MKIIEKPVTQIETTDDLNEIKLVIVTLLKSLKNIYENSNFYKEARIVSFIDRLLDCILSKFKSQISITISIQKAINNDQKYF